MFKQVFLFHVIPFVFQLAHRVQFRSVVYGMLSQQRLLETLKDLLLSSCPSNMPSSSAGRHLSLGAGSSCHNEPILLTSEVTQRLMLSLCDVYNLCYEFDRRPGLKFLLQKVAHARVAVNLYKQSGVCITLLLHALVDICRRSSVEVGRVTCCPKIARWGFFSKLRRFVTCASVQSLL